MSRDYGGRDRAKQAKYGYVFGRCHPEQSNTNKVTTIESRISQAPVAAGDCNFLSVPPPSSVYPHPQGDVSVASSLDSIPSISSASSQHFKLNCHQVMNRVGTTLIRFSQRSTFHGLNHLAQARSAHRRIFWLAISLFASIGFFTNLYFLIYKYMQTPILTNVLHDAQPFIYPDVTFCFVNSIYFPPRNSSAYQELVRHFSAYDQLVAKGLNNKIKLSDYLYMQPHANYTHPAWSAVVQCHYQHQPCNWQHFDVRRLWPWGSCFTLNATKMNMKRDIRHREIKKKFRPDFKLIIYKALDRPADFTRDLHNGVDLPPGIALMIHEPGTFPPRDECAIVNGCTQVDIKMTWVSHLAHLSKCSSKRDILDLFDIGSGTSYSVLARQADCIDTIVQQSVALECHCLIHSLPISNNISHLDFCFNGRFNISYLNDCLLRSQAHFSVEHCFLDLCEHFSMTRVVSQSSYPGIRDRFTHRDWLRVLAGIEVSELEHFGNTSDLAEKALLPHANATGPPMRLTEVVRQGRVDLLNTDFVERNFLMLRIQPSGFFMDKVLETVEYPLSHLLSDIGGCVGLWIGASLITLFECVDLVLDMAESWSMRVVGPLRLTSRWKAQADQKRYHLQRMLVEQQRLWVTGFDGRLLDPGQTVRQMG
ncbi:unnamed protein product, partial [Protopolystoma xenopodis]